MNFNFDSMNDFQRQFNVTHFISKLEITPNLTDVPSLTEKELKERKMKTGI